MNICKIQLTKCIKFKIHCGFNISADFPSLYSYRIQWSSHSWYSGKMAGETLPLSCSFRALSIAFS